MRRGLRIARAAVSLGGAAGLLAFAFTVPPALAEDQTVQAGSPGANVFSPKIVTVDVGDTVTWQWGGGFGHTVTGTSPNWGKDSPVGPPAATLSTTRAFTKAGTYTYICKTHGEAMSGSVVVNGGATPKPTVRPSSPRPTSSRPTTSSQPSTPGPSASESVTPTPSTGSATPVQPGSVTPSPSPSPDVLLPTIATPPPGGNLYLGTGGLTPEPPTGRHKGLPVMLALLLIGGIGSAELRALLATAPPR